MSFREEEEKKKAWHQSSNKRKETVSFSVSAEDGEEKVD